jgi:hypothetical protein
MAKKNNNIEVASDDAASTIEVAVATSKPTKKFKHYLENRKVKVQPVEAGAKWANLLVRGEERKKDAHLFNKAKRSFQVPKPRQGGIVKLLDNYEANYTPQFPNEKLTQQGFFEKILGTDLNPLKDENNFWKHNKKSRVTITKDGLLLDLSDPMDMIHYMILCAQDVICVTYENRFIGNFDFVIVDENKIVSKKIEASQAKANAYSRLAEVLASDQKMINFVKATGKHVPARVTTEWLKDQVITNLDNSHTGFLNIVEDTYFEDKVFVYDAVKVGGIIKKSSNNYALDNGKDLGTLNDTIHYFRDPEHQELKLRITSQIERVNDK